MTHRRIENAQTLASLLKIDTEEAVQLLDISFAITVELSDPKGQQLALILQDLLERTITSAQINATGTEPSLEIVIGTATPRFSISVRVNVSTREITIGTRTNPESIAPDSHSIVVLLAGAYAAGMALHHVLGDRLPIGGPSIEEGLTISLREIFGQDENWINAKFNLADTYLAGAGAIGNGFLYALQHFSVSGLLTIVDPDSVSDGNLNRCVFFSQDDVGKSKSKRLEELAQPHFPNLTLTHEISTLQALGKKHDSSNWLKRLIVGVDSRRTRRILQSEIPGEVFDASTTGVVEGVFHHHKQPTEAACLACIYHEAHDELARERHMAETLGVTLEHITEHYVSADAAFLIHKKYPHVPLKEIKGQAYDSLFKALCSQQTLLSADNRQVLAPFAFVSVLTGAYLAIEVARRIVLGRDSFTFNYWRFSPWAAPVHELKSIRLRNPECEFCSNKTLVNTAIDLWAR
jgi:hypothetical protein